MESEAGVGESRGCTADIQVPRGNDSAQGNGNAVWMRPAVPRWLASRAAIGVMEKRGHRGYEEALG